MISRKAYEIASIIGKSGGFKIEMTSEQVENWYKHLCIPPYSRGYYRLSVEDKDEIIDLNGLGFGLTDISNRTGHTRACIKNVLYENESDTIYKRTKKMQIYEMFGCAS